MRTSFRFGVLGATLTAVLAACPVTQGGPLEDFTGYTRIGFPPTEGKVDPKFAQAAKEMKAIGLTIYYMVYDRKTGKSVAGDIYGVGIESFDATFFSGLDSDRGKLDTETRYLYLYQVVNDSGRPAVVKDIAIRLLVDPRLITSWGYFVKRTKNEKGVVGKQGLGFSMQFDGKGAGKDLDLGAGIRPISSDFPGVSDKAYRSPAPAIKATKPYGISPITLNIAPAAGSGQDMGKEPSDVLIVPNVDFGDVADNGDGLQMLKPRLVGDHDPLDDIEDPKARARMRDQFKKRWPAVRTFFREDPVGPKQRSTIWGFTSDLPPVMAEATAKGKSLGIGLGHLQDNKNSGTLLAAVQGQAEKGNPGRKNTASDLRDPQFVALQLPVDPNRLMKQGEKGAATPPIGGTLPTPSPGKKADTATPAGDISPAPVPTVGGEGGGAGSALGGGTGTVGGGGITGVSPPPAFFPARGNGGAGGGIGGGSGGGSGSQSGNGTQSGTGSQSGTANQFQTLNNPVNVSVNQSQSQAQAQAQAQAQSQSQSQTQTNGCCCDGTTVVPAPPAWLLGMLGLPVFAFLARKRKKTTAELPAE